MANSLRSRLKKLNYQGKITVEELNELLEKLDGHDRELIKHGHWIFIGTISDGENDCEVFRCSNCMIPNDKTSKFCPNCGAIMDEEV